MAVTGQISIARVGRTVQIFEDTADIIDVFNPDASPTLQNGDHVTLYPGDYREDLEQAGGIRIPGTGSVDEIEVFVTILPGAIVNYGSLTGPVEQRYKNIEGAVRNIADLNIAEQYTTESETQSPRVRVYPEDPTTIQGSEVPFAGFKNLDLAAEAADPGDSILVFPGKYSPSNNLYVSEGTWNFLDGAVVEYKKDFSGGSQYPHALFDDIRTVDGQSNIGGQNCEIRGNAEFIIGAPTEQPVQGSGFNATTFSDEKDWDDWHMYSLLGVNGTASNVDFEAKRVVVEDYTDAVFKISDSSSVNIDIGEVKIDSSIVSASNLPITNTPSFCHVNGITSSAGNISVDIDDLIVNAGSSKGFHLFTGENSNSGERSVFDGNIEISVQNTDTLNPQTASRFIRFTNSISPEKVIIENSNISENNAGIYLSGEPTVFTKFILKNSEVSTEGVSGTPPIVLDGDPNGFDIHLANIRLITGESLDFDTTIDPKQHSIQNRTSSTGFDIKAYGDCFADSPVQEFTQILHDELNNITWSEDVESLS